MTEILGLYYSLFYVASHTVTYAPSRLQNLPRQRRRSASDKSFLTKVNFRANRTMQERINSIGNRYPHRTNLTLHSTQSQLQSKTLRRPHPIKTNLSNRPTRTHKRRRRNSLDTTSDRYFPIIIKYRT